MKTQNWEGWPALITGNWFGETEFGVWKIIPVICAELKEGYLDLNYN